MEQLAEPRAPGFLVIGHLTQDLDHAGYQLGGTAAYAALVAAHLGLNTSVLTRAATSLDVAALLPGIHVLRLPSETTTVFEHRYQGGRRLQYLRARAASLRLDDVPRVLRDAQTVLLGPVIEEVDPWLSSAFPSAIIGATAQGWLRCSDETGLVHDGQFDRLEIGALAGRLTALFVSEEDLGGVAPPSPWLEQIPIVVITRGSAGARVALKGSWWHIPAFPAREVDPTGAGDAFAAAFLVRYRETGDPAQAALFGAATASFIVESLGVSGAPSRSQVLQRLRDSPNLQLQAA